MIIHDRKTDKTIEVDSSITYMLDEAISHAGGVLDTDQVITWPDGETSSYYDLECW